MTPNLVAQHSDLEEDVALYACRNLYRDGLLNRGRGEFYQLSEFGREYLEGSSKLTGIFDIPPSQIEQCSVSVESIIEDVLWGQQTNPTSFQRFHQEVWLTIVTRSIPRDTQDEEIAKEVIERFSLLFGKLVLERMKHRIEELDRTLQFILDDYSSDEIVNPFDDEREVSLDEEEWESIKLSIQTAILIDDVLGFYNLLTGLLEVVSADLIVSEIATDSSYSDKMDMFDQIYGEWSEYQREMFLETIGVIEREQQKVASRLRTHRNRLIHDIGTRFQGNYVRKSLEDMQAGLDLIDELTVQGEEGVVP